MTTINTGTRGPYKTGRKRQREIIDAAIAVFGSRGYGGSTIKEIAAVAGVTPAAVLRYFSKEQLLTEVLRDWDQRQGFVDSAGPGLAFFRTMRELMEYHVAHRDHLELYLTFATEASDARHPAHDFMYMRYRRSLAKMRRRLTEAIDLGEVPCMDEATITYEIECLHAILDGVEMQWLLNPDVDLVGVVGQYVDQAISRWSAGTTLQEPSPRVPAW